jgi:hypothetical protein
MLHRSKRFQKGTQQPKGNIMIDFDKQLKEVTAQVKKYNEMWINWTITVLEQIKK